MYSSADNGCRSIVVYNIVQGTLQGSDLLLYYLFIYLLNIYKLPIRFCIIWVAQNSLEIIDVKYIVLWSKQVLKYYVANITAQYRYLLY